MPQQKGQSNARGLARREEILEAASELFATRGYRGSGILELAKRVGMSHVGILHHFGTKENLLRAVIERRDEKYDHLMSEYVDGGLDAFMEAYVSDVNSFMEPDVLTRLGTVLRSENLSPGDPLNEYFDGRTKQLRDFLASDIRAGQIRGDYRSDVDPAAKAAEILAFTIGLDVQWLLNKDAIDLQAVFASFARTLVDDLTRPDAPRVRVSNPRSKRQA